VLVATLASWGCGSSAEDEGERDRSSFTYPLDDLLRINQLQAKGTHNSYHVQTEGSDVTSWKYTHAPLDVQLGKQGVRKFELDTQYSAEVEAFEVFHLALLDEETTCRLFVDCLATIKAWSDRNPAHHVVFVQIEPKDRVPADAEAYFADFEAEILSVWPRERLVTPADVQGSAATLREAVLANGWPTLGATRGKLLFFVNDAGSFREAYTYGGQRLDDRLMFVESSPEHDYAGVLIINGPEGNVERIQQVVSDGFLVRTRADSDIGESLAGGNQAQVLAALESGAQVLSTDFPAPVESTSYFFEVPGGTPSRCNPVNAPAECTSEAIEDPAFVGP
jgi:hypothetical protein